MEPTISAIIFTEIDQLEEVTVLQKNTWYDLYIYVEDPQGFDDIAFADLWFNSPAYTEGTIENRGGIHYATRNYIWSYSIASDKIWSRQTEGTDVWSDITGILGLYTDDDNNEYEINRIEGWAKARVKVLDTADEGVWVINCYVVDKSGNKSGLFSKPITVLTEIPIPPTEPTWWEKHWKKVLVCAAVGVGVGLLKKFL